MDAVPDGVWYMLAAAVVAAALVIALAPPLATGAICAWKMKNLPMRRGLLWGAVVGAAALILNIATNLANIGSFTNLALVVLSVIATWLLCRRSAKRERKGLGDDV